MDEQEERIEMLKRFFATRDELMNKLRAVDANISAFGAAYWKAQGYKAIPRIEKLRQELGI